MVTEAWGKVSPRGFLRSPGVKPDLPVAASGGSAQLLRLPLSTEVTSVLEAWAESGGWQKNPVPCREGAVQQPRVEMELVLQVPR